VAFTALQLVEVSAEERWVEAGSEPRLWEFIAARQSVVAAAAFIVVPLSAAGMAIGVLQFVVGIAECILVRPTHRIVVRTIAVQELLEPAAATIEAIVTMPPTDLGVAAWAGVGASHSLRD
jgi:hypothetical protein